MFTCKEPEMSAYRYEVYKNIEKWLREQDTQHMLFDMIMAALLKRRIEHPPEYNNYWGPTKRKLKTLTQLQIMQGFLPTGMWQQQHEYYIYMGSKKQGITWGTKLCKKLIEASHSMWTKRNTFEHDRKLHGLIEVEDVRLKTAVKAQYLKGITGIRISDRYLFNNSMIKLWSKNGTYIRSWLATVLIARGLYQEAKMELRRSRENMGYERKRPTGVEIKKCKKRRKDLKSKQK